MHQIPEQTLRAIQQHFHRVIRDRAGDSIDRHRLTLPELAPLVASSEPKAWFPVPGMSGGFSYWLEGEGEQMKLISENWCWDVEGSGQRHEISASGWQLVDEGFV
jgi:hypothetical protein